jgi:hypothetical protein
MLFKLVNALTIFQFYINSMLNNLLNIYYIIHIDNILIYLITQKCHKKDIKVILNYLKSTKLFIKISKCEFAINKKFFLKFIIKFTSIEIKSN